MTAGPRPVAVKQNAVGPLRQIEMTISMPSLGRSMHLAVFQLGRTLIDAGAVSAAPELVEALADRPPERILLTHQHEDHFGGVAALRRAYGNIPVYAPRPHLTILAGFEALPPYRAVTWGQPEPLDDAIPYDPGATFEEGDVVLEAVATPGHTPGHISLLARTQTPGQPIYAVTGDLYLSAHPIMAWYESAADDRARSCRTLAGQADDVWLLPAHGRVRQEGGRVLSALADWLEQEMAAVHALSERLGTRDYGVLAEERYAPNPLEDTSLGEFSRRCFIRSVLDPVRTLPAQVPR